MWQNEVVPRLRPRTGDILFTRLLRVAGLGESSVEERLGELLHSDKPDRRNLCQTRRGGRARHGQSGDRGGGAGDGGRRWMAQRASLGQHIFGVDDETPQSVALKLMTERKLTLATMESCTGGLLASLITDIPGSLDDVSRRTHILRDGTQRGVGRPARGGRATAS